jgi:hypothetical protein
MDTLPLKHTKWSNRLAFDIALMLEGSGETLDELKERHSVSTDDVLVFNKVSPLPSSISAISKASRFDHLVCLSGNVSIWLILCVMYNPVKKLCNFTPSKKRLLL